MYPGFWFYTDMARPIDPEMTATEETVCYLQFLPRHMGPRREAPGSVRRHRMEGKAWTKDFFLEWFFFLFYFIEL